MSNSSQPSPPTSELMVQVRLLSAAAVEVAVIERRSLCSLCTDWLLIHGVVWKWLGSRPGRGSRRLVTTLAANLAGRAAVQSHMTANGSEEGPSVIWFLMRAAAQEVDADNCGGFCFLSWSLCACASSVCAQVQEILSDCLCALFIENIKWHIWVRVARQSHRSQVRAMYQGCVDVNRSSLLHRLRRHLLLWRAELISSLMFQRVVSLKTRLAFLSCLLVVVVVYGGQGLLKNASFLSRPLQ